MTPMGKNATFSIERDGSTAVEIGYRDEYGQKGAYLVELDEDELTFVEWLVESAAAFHRKPVERIAP